MKKIFSHLLFAFFTSLILSSAAFASEVNIDSAIHATAATHNGGSPTVVFISDQNGYIFYRDSTGSCVYSKTVNGGAAWGAAITVDSQTDCLKIAVWYDRWTPGDSSGTNIHIVTMDAGDLWYAKLDTSVDSLTAAVNATGANQGGAFASGNVTSITKSTSGVIYMGAQDAGDSFVIKCGASCDSAINWTEAGTNPFDLAVDSLILMPLSSGNIIAIRVDTSADTVGSKVYNSAGNSWDAAWAVIDAAATDNATYDAAFGATLNKTTGDIFLSYAADIATFGTNDDIRTASYAGGIWTAKTNALTNDARGITGTKIGFDENTGDIYLIYSARTAPGTASTGNLYYKKSTDNMASWGAETQINSTTGDIYGARLNILSDERLFTAWFSATVDDLFGNTIADLTPGGDTTAPAAVSDLSVSSPTPSALDISWTAPGDDDNTGTATSYDLRYSTAAINDGNFSSATAATGEPVPSVAGSSESMTVSGLSSGTTYYFALKTSDEVPNVSAISNLPSGTTSVSGDSTAPVVTAFTMPATATSLIVFVSSFTATDNIAVTGYLITESASTPSGSSPDWSGSAPASFAFSGSGTVTAYAWAKDAAGNISAGVSASVTITLPSADSFSGGAGPSVMPTTIGMSGKSYPGAEVTLVARQSGGIISENKIPVLPKGDFSFILSEIPQGNYTYSLLAEDRDGEKSQVKIFNVDFISTSLFERRVLVSPTMKIGSPAIRKGDFLKAEGYAYPGTKIILNLGDINFSTTTPDSGLYEFSVNTSLLGTGNNFTRSRQIDLITGQESDWSVTKNFEILPFLTVSLDFNRDGIINITDWSIFLSRSKAKDTGIVKTIDFNQDGKIDISDFSIFLRNFKNN